MFLFWNRIPKILLYVSLILFVITSCKKENKETNDTSITSVEKKTVTPKKQRPLAFENGKFFEIDNKKMLYGGEDSLQHFDITGYELKDKQFNYGIGRERFPALLQPEFITVQEANTIWADSTRFLLAYSGNDIKAYSVKDLTRHEVVNDVLNDEPIMAVYCILADLGAIYSLSLIHI